MASKRAGYFQDMLIFSKSLCAVPEGHTPPHKGIIRKHCLLLLQLHSAVMNSLHSLSASPCILETLGATRWGQYHMARCGINLLMGCVLNLNNHGEVLGI